MQFKEIPISLQLQAGFIEFLGFLWDIEHTQTFLKVKLLSIENNPKSSSRHNITLTLNVYQLIEEETEIDEDNAS